jgi:hypothetical protein
VGICILLLGLKCIPRYFGFVVHPKFFILLSLIPLIPSLSSSRVCLLHPDGNRATGCRPHFISDLTGHFVSAEAYLLNAGQIHPVEIDYTAELMLHTAEC